jgi:hypothetical protein
MKGRVRQALTLTPDRGTFDHRLTPTAHRLTRAALSFPLVVMDGGGATSPSTSFRPAYAPPPSPNPPSGSGTAPLCVHHFAYRGLG